MDRSERTIFMKALGASVREYVEKADSRLRTWVSGELKALADLVEERVKSLPVPKDGKDGRDGIDGKDAPDVSASVMELRRAVSGEIESLHAHFTERINAIPAVRDGKDGKDGIDGKDAAPINRVEFLNYIDGKIEDKAKGLIAKDGRDGTNGKDGAAGKDGESIHPDSIRLMVIDQIGEVISRIPKPEDGRDALQIDIIEAEEGKLYSRGTFATWQGGLVRFNGKTWDTVVRGIHTVDVVRAEDLRTFTVKVGLTDGAIVEKQFAMPVLLDRGVYRANEEYLAGDTVSHQGSGWVCIADKTSTSPSTPNQRDWRLQIKAGRDGRDIKPTNTFDPVVRLK